MIGIISQTLFCVGALKFGVRVDGALFSWVCSPSSEDVKTVAEFDCAVTIPSIVQVSSLSPTLSFHRESGDDWAVACFCCVTSDHVKGVTAVDDRSTGDIAAEGIRSNTCPTTCLEVIRLGFVVTRRITTISTDGKQDF